jgi:hypothetical protein
LPGKNLVAKKGKNQQFLAARTTYGLTKRWPVAGELSGTLRQGVKPFTQFLTVTSYFFSP